MDFSCTSTAIAVQPLDVGERVVELHCGKWECTDCRKRLRAKWIRIAIAGKPERFLTLTMRAGDGPPPPNAGQRLLRAFRSLLQRARREFGWRGIAYTAVLEATARGWPHLHVLLRCPYWDVKWISDRMAEYIDSPIVYMEAVRNVKGVAKYVAKYLAKEPHKFEGCRRIWRTPSWSKDHQPEKHVWQWATGPFVRVARTWWQWVDHKVRIGWQRIDEPFSTALISPLGAELLLREPDWKPPARSLWGSSSSGSPAASPYENPG